MTSTSSGAHFLLNAPLSLAVSITWMLIAFATSRVAKKNAVVDIFWGSGFVVILLSSLLASCVMSSHAGTSGWWSATSFAPTTRTAVAVAVGLWGIRLSAHLVVRQRGHGEDSRYERIMKGSSGRNQTWYALRTIYLFQALLMWFISIPLQWIAFAPNFNPIVLWLGVTVILGGTTCESVADIQLTRFVNSPGSSSRTLSQGLWRYSRHPNYFGDAVVWWGIFLASASTRWGLLTVLSPLAMTYLLTSFSGKPLLEAKLTRTRVGYDEYVARTSGFVPRRPKRI